MKAMPQFLLTLAALSATLLNMAAQTTAFTYQGQLDDGGNPASGIYDLRFMIFDSSGGPTVIAGPLTNSPTLVSNGLFTVVLDFGAGVFSGANRWLEIGARPYRSGAFAILTPRQLVTPSPHALFAPEAGTAASALSVASNAVATAALQDGAITSAKILDATIVNADIAPAAGIVDTKLAGITSAGKVANSATTATSTNVARAIVARDNSGNFAAGIISADAFAGSGAALTALNASQLASGSVPNARLSATVSQLGQTIESSEITDGTLQAADVNAAGFNTTFWRTDGNAGTVAGTHFLGTTENQPLELKVGGLRALRIENNVDGSDPGLISDGAPNFIAGSPGNFVAAGVVGATISGGGSTNYDGFTRTNAVLADYGTVGGGLANQVASSSVAGVIGGGFANDLGADAAYGTVGGGFNNNLASGAQYATIGGGIFNDLGTNAEHSAILGGYDNNILTAGRASAIVGGTSNRVGANLQGAFIGGGTRNTIADQSTNAVIGGGRLNAIGMQSLYATIGGGRQNTIGDATYEASIAGGVGNEIRENATASIIGGGSGNTIQNDAPYATLSGGSINTIFTGAAKATIGGGRENQISSSALSSLIAGGEDNLIGASSPWSAILGGEDNVILPNAKYGVVAGGYSNHATNRAFAAGSGARALHSGSFVWADYSGALVYSSTNHEFTARAAGGYRLFTNPLMTSGVFLPANGIAWGILSDRNRKKDIQPVDGEAVLEKLAQLPAVQWHYDWEDSDQTPHLGTLAQDFKAAFYPGRDDKIITTQEFDGVALAAIQGLNEKVEGRSAKAETRLQQLEAENADLKSRLERLEQLLESQLTGGAK